MAYLWCKHSWKQGCQLPSLLYYQQPNFRGNTACHIECRSHKRIHLVITDSDVVLSFDRLIMHGMCQYLSLLSRSKQKLRNNCCSPVLCCPSECVCVCVCVWGGGGGGGGGDSHMSKCWDVCLEFLFRPQRGTKRGVVPKKRLAEMETRYNKGFILWWSPLHWCRSPKPVPCQQSMLLCDCFSTLSVTRTWDFDP